jgi:hypothetical protein
MTLSDFQKAQSKIAKAIHNYEISLTGTKPQTIHSKTVTLTELNKLIAKFNRKFNNCHIPLNPKHPYSKHQITHSSYSYITPKEKQINER